MPKWTLYLIILFQTALVLWLTTKIVVDRIPEEHPVATWYYKTNTWLCDVDMDWKSFPVTLAPLGEWSLYAYDFPTKINEEALLINTEWRISICVPLYSYISE